MRWRAGGRVIPAAGGGAAGASWQSYVPAATTPDSDPNSIVSSATVSAGFLEATLQSPGAYPLPSQGAIWDCGPLLNGYGAAYTAIGGDAPSLMARIADVLPADTWAGALVATGTPGSASVESFGAIIDDAGKVTVYNRSSSGSEQTGTSGTGDTDVRLALFRSLVQTTDSQRYMSGLGYGVTGVPLITRGLAGSFIVGTAGWSRVWLAAGWVAGTGGPTATVRVCGRTLGALASTWISDGGL